MQSKHALTIICFVIIVVFVKPVQAEGFYSVASLTLLCGNRNPSNDFACKTYIRGVVETWMLKDIVGVNPDRYSSRGNEPTFCETISKVSDDEWLKIIRSNLNSMKPGFAADAVMDALFKQLCK